MRVNVYAEEMTDKVEVIGKDIEGQRFTGLRFYLQLPATVDGKQYQGPFMHRPGDDDSSAVTFWGKRDLREALRQGIDLLDKHYAAQPRTGYPKIGFAYPGEPGTYAGVIVGDDKFNADYHLVVLDGDRDDLTWSEALEWAKAQGGELPKRKEQAVMFGNVPQLFEQRYYWSCEQYAAGDDYAWVQSFRDGYQNYGLKSFRCRARAVRRLPF